MAKWSERQRRCLAGMGIPLWERRASAALPIADAAIDPSVEAPLVTLAAEVPPPEVPLLADIGWDELATRVAACERCLALVANRSRTVFGVGNRTADLMVIGEAPGADEDRQGEPFVGRAGKLLDAMLLAIGLPRATVYIANVLKCRPPDNRDPQPQEAAACSDFLQRQIALVAPRALLVVGRIAAQQLLNTDEPIGRLRGRPHRFGDRPLVVTYHPAYLLRSPAEKRKAWMDLREVRRLLEGAV